MWASSASCVLSHVDFSGLNRNGPLTHHVPFGITLNPLTHLSSFFFLKELICK